MRHDFQDSSFDYGPEGRDAYEAVGPVLVDSGCVEDEESGRDVCRQLALRIRRHGLVESGNQVGTV